MSILTSTRRRILSLVICIGALQGLNSPAQAVATAEDWSMCSVPVITRGRPADNDKAITEVEADYLFGQDENLYFQGDVSLSRGTQRVEADTLRWTRQPERIEAIGNIDFSDELINIRSQSLSLNHTEDSGLFLDNEFQILDHHLRGEALRIEQMDAQNQHLQDVTFTTCDPDDDAWSLRAESLDIDQETRQGTARDAVLRVRSVPVFYFPWVMFPVGDDRMSGILAPTIGASSAHGSELGLPVYLNLAANFDMTLTPVWYGERSLQLNTENRYLTENHVAGYACRTSTMTRRAANAGIATGSTMPFSGGA